MAPLIAALMPALGTLIDRLIPDKAQAEKTKAEMEAQLVDAANKVNLGQIETNKIEAAHRSLWVAGWRPGLGWTCAAGFFWAFVGQPVAAWILALTGTDVALPDIDSAPMLELTFAMLGLGGLRTFEKLKGIAK